MKRYEVLVEIRARATIVIEGKDELDVRQQISELGVGAGTAIGFIPQRPVVLKIEPQSDIEERKPE